MMSAEIMGCCENSTEWIFLYENGEIYSICQTHFNSIAHRCLVKKVINFRTKKDYTPDEIFGEDLCGPLPQL